MTENDGIIEDNVYERLFVCPFCVDLIPFVKESACKQHLQKFHDDAKSINSTGSATKVTAGNCIVLARTRVAVTNVRNKYLQENASEYMCDICFRSFKTNQKLKLHEASAHIKVYKFKCLICSHLAYTRQSMCNHLKRVHGYHGDEINEYSLLALCGKMCTSETQEQPVFKCTEDGCRDEFPTAHRLLMHKVTHSSANFRCRPCNKQLASFTLLAAHIESEHPGFKVYICGIGDCPKSYDNFMVLKNRWSILRPHMNVSNADSNWLMRTV